MRWWEIEIFVDDSILSQLFEAPDFEEYHHHFVYPVASHSYRYTILLTIDLFDVA